MICPVTVKEPVMVWFPLNWFEPVVANTVLSLPSNRSALKAYEAEVAKDADVANEEDTAFST